MQPDMCAVCGVLIPKTYCSAKAILLSHMYPACHMPWVLLESGELVVVVAAAVAVVYAQYKFCVSAFRDAGDTKTREPSMPVSTSTGPDPDKPSAPSESALLPLARADEDEMMEDVAEMAGGGQVSGQDALANLETTLRPVEKYAVRFLEEVSSAKFSHFTLKCYSLLRCCTFCNV